MFLNKKLLLLCKSVIPLFLIVTINSCGIYKKADARKIPAGADARVAKNIEEGKGMVTGKNLFGGSSGTNYEFATSNELWRAALSVLDFLPLSNVDYSGGIIITDWYNEGTSNDESIKITVRFLTTEIRSDAVQILIHKKICNKGSNCKIAKISMKTNFSHCYCYKFCDEEDKCIEKPLYSLYEKEEDQEFTVHIGSNETVVGFKII